MQLLFLRQWFSDETLQAIGWTLIHSLWQGLLAAVAAAIIIICTRKTAAGVRYNLLGIVMVLFLVTTFFTFGKQLNIAAIQGSTDPSSPVVAAGEVFLSTGTPVDNVTVSAGFMDEFITWFNTHADLFVLAWTLFFVMNCLKLFTGIASVHRLRHYKTHPVAEEWKENLERLSKMLGIRRSVSLLQSELVKVPVALGFLKPVILLPMGLITHLPPGQVETILLHELAHIRRRDYIVNLVQRFAEAIFFFNPALLWISSLIRQEREACCDDIVIANTDQKKHYLDALVAFQEYSLKSTYAMAISSRRDYLLSRVKRMLTRENKKLDLLEKMVLVAGLLIFSAFTYLSKEKQVSVEDKFDQIVLNQGRTQVTEPGTTGESTVKVADQRIRVSQSSGPKDTVPPKKLLIQKMFEGKQLKSVTSNTTHENGVEKMIVYVTGPDDTKYVIRKINGQIIELINGDKKVDSKELSAWSPLFERVDATIKGKVRENEMVRKQDEAIMKQVNQAVEQEAIRQGKINEEVSKHMEKQHKMQQKIEQAKAEFQQKTQERDKKMSGLNDSIQEWGRQLMQEMNRMQSDLKSLQNKDILNKNGNKDVRIEEPRNEKDRKDPPRIQKKNDKKDVRIEEPRNEKDRKDPPRIQDKRGGKDVRIEEPRNEKDRKDTHTQTQTHTPGVPNKDNGSNKPKDSHETRVSRNTDNIVKLNNGFTYNSEIKSSFLKEVSREMKIEMNKDMNEEKNEKKNEKKNDDSRRGRKPVFGNHKPNTDLKLNAGYVAKVNVDFENAIKKQTNENLLIEYKVETNGVQYAPLSPTNPPAPPAPVKPGNKAKPESNKKLNLKPKTSLFRMDKYGWNLYDKTT